MSVPDVLVPGPAVPAGPRRQLLRRLDALDLKLYRRAAGADLSLLDAVLPRLTRSADHGLLWLGIASVLAVAGDRGPRRAAVRGLASLAVASATANLPGKLLARRTRPDLRPVPLARHLRRQPLTTSFPSGHSASAAAFTLGVLGEQPVLALPVGVLAAGVAYGRVHTGVHYPGDVAAGLALGAVAALAVRRAWPARPAAGRVTPDPASAPALPGGAGLTVVLNTDSGDAARTACVEDELRTHLPAAVVVRTTGDGLDEALREAVTTATALGVAGGDGTVGAAAAVALDAGLPLAVVPGGTLNHFAAELGITGVEQLAHAVARGEATRVTVGSSTPDGDGGLFLNTLAVGVYPELVREREQHEDRLGKWPAMALATARVLRSATPVRLSVGGHDRTVWTLFAGNGHYHPAGFAPTWRERLDDGTIDVRLIDADRSLARLRLVLAVLTGRLGRSRVYEQRIVARLDVDGAEETLRVARDGEVSQGPPKLTLRAAARPLTVYRPRP